MKVHVSLGDRSYDIKIESGIIDHLSAIPEFKQYKKIIALTDTNLYRLYKSQIEGGRFTKVIQLPPGEETKSFTHLQQIWDEMVTLKLDRKSLLVVIGGGVLGDLGGFAASTYMRGIDFIQIPTTLLSQVDSSVGGKTGINHPSGKNLIGAFYQPKAVYIDVNVLKTLPESEFKSGLGEVVKYGVIRDEPFFEYLREHAEEILDLRSDVLSFVISKCCKIKAEVVGADEKENGVRAILNYGHSVAHGLENVCHYQGILHGQAVTFGMDVEMYIAARRGIVLEKDFARQRALIDALHLGFLVPPFEMDKFLAAITLDKKNTNDRLNFVLPTKIGEVIMVDNINFEEIAECTKNALRSPIFLKK
jgi:3-dehydroquinate synthase